MTDSQSLKRLFPSDGTLPDEHRLAAQIHQPAYLINGRLQPWDGPCRTVLSPVCATLADGTVQQVPIGSCPEMGAQQSDAALDAAACAYDSGRGAWPTMTVAGRITCMQRFVKGMVLRRQAIANLIMWEIGKSIADSLKEFDRTVEYIQATIAALKVMDNGHSRFTVVEGTIGQVRRTPLGVVREEQFGPVVPVMAFDEVQEALDYVITPDHGQQVSIFGSDAAQIGALVDPLVNQVCRVNINCQCQRGPDVFPFAGRKDSAEGTLSVSDALRAFSIRSMVAARQTESNKQLLNAIVRDHQSKFINTGFIL